MYFLYRDWRKASVYTFLVMCTFFFFGSFHDGVKHLLEDSILTKYKVIIPFLMAFYVLLYFLIKKTSSRFHRLTGYLNVLLIVLIVWDLGQWIFVKKTVSATETSQLVYSVCDTCSKPDIYFIIADEYLGNRTLKEQFGFDNSDFENELKTRGFHIINNSRSNYNFTPYSIASILNMDYLNGITKKSNDNKNRNICYSLINHNALTQFISAQGYSFVNHSLFDFSGQPTEVNSMFFLTKEKLITHQTLLGRMDRDIRFNLVTRFKIQSEISRVTMGTLENNQKLIEDTYTTLNSETATPRFVYTHLMMPHYPYYFNRLGRPFPLDSIVEGNQVNKHQYIEYLQYCNKTFLNFLDSLMLGRKKPPIIVFMGDHGFRHFKEPVNEAYQFLNLNAVYLPTKNYKGFYDDMSAVNQFRIIFNTQFRQSFPLLKDSTIYLKEYD
ncbi:MAG TPA: sulfatase-like hydrolase/transferase [Chitinophagaceae bacterium]